MKKSYTFFLLASLLTSSFCQSQVIISDYPADTPNENAILELRSLTENKGLLMPKVALTATNAAAPFASHVSGITVYNTQIAGTYPYNVVPGFYYNDGTSWSRITINKPVVGDVKHSALTSDHQGWYLLNGRNVSTLPASAQTYAAGLGFATVLPNATGRFLKAKQGAEVLGAAAGNASFTLTQANLPSFTFTPTVSSAGSHSHTYRDRASGTGNSAEGSSVQTVVDNTNSASLNTSSSGAHTHTYTISTGGTNTPKTFTPAYMATNIFVYLGE